ncbi:hypothetical protein OQA88_1800 [Cercophora sp. LCS_1]
MTCSVCNNFKGIHKKEEIGAPTRHKGNRNHIKIGLSWDVIIVSAKSCPICELLTIGIRGCWQQHNVKESDVQSFSLFFYYEGWHGDVADTNKEFRFQLADGRYFDIELFATEDQQGSRCPIPAAWEFETFPRYERTSPRSNSGEVLDKIEGWIEECLSPSHEFCTAPAEAELPTRVIDVGTRDSPVIRLVEPLGKAARYVCLSHCWGKEQIITTKKATIQERLAGIRMEELSKTFQDAVILTRRLGVRYIWIDSLCIIQDDLEDWEVESAKMCSVYSEAYLTVAATHSPDGRGGLFRETPDFEVSGVIPGTEGGDYRVFFRERIDHQLDCVGQTEYMNGTGHETIAYYPILTRAWVYQERMLSTRVLHFGRYEVFFECRSDVSCECGGIGWHGSSITAPTPLTKLVHSNALDSQLPGADWAEVSQYYIARLWRTMVSSYTCLGITKHADRLPAMGGLARHMAMRRKSKYLAGLWEDVLIDDLLWYCDGNTASKRPRPVPRTAPTWSWASIDRHILYTDEILMWDPENEEWNDEREPYEHFAQVEECAVVPGGVDEFGGILQGRLRISGLVATGVLELDTEIVRGQESTVYQVLFPDGEQLELKADYLLDEPGGEKVPLGAKVVCLKMAWMQAGPFDIFTALVLRPVAETPSVYRRIGCIRIMADTGAPLAVNPFEQVFGSADTESVTII